MESSPAVSVPPGSWDGNVATRLRHNFRRHFGEEASSSPSEGESLVVARAPGRVNLLGGHTDYSDGFVLPATIDRSVRIAARARGDGAVRLHSLRFEEEVEYAASDVDIETLPGWARYVAGVAEQLSRRGHLVGGFDAVIEGDVPLGAGLSSSAALEVAVALGLDALFSLDLEAVETAQICQRAEQEHVGVECGIMDQFASRVGQASCALFLDCRSLEYEHVPLPLAEEDACLIVADSGVRRELASSKYNERRRECEEAARHFRRFAGESVRTLRDVPEDLLEAHGTALPEPLFRRARHVVSENRRVEEGADLLAKGDLGAFGALMNASHASLASDYAVSCEELDALAEAARETPGVLGARMTGAGFGGCTITLARRAAVERFLRAAQERFDGRKLTTYVVERNFEAGLP